MHDRQGTFGEVVSRLRANAGISRATLADKAGLSPATIRRIELDQRDARLSYLVAIASAFGIELADLAAQIGRAS